MAAPMKTWQILLLGILLGLLMAGLILLISAPPRGKPISLIQTEANLDSPEDQTANMLNGVIKVHVTGAVQHPGLWDLQEGDRVNDAIVMAGGLTSEADMTRINLAARLADGMRVYIPEIGEVISLQDQTDSLTSPDKKMININTATRDELATLPAIGLAKADAIIAYRKANGDFMKIEDILNVSGIGDSIFEQIKQLITIDNQG